MQGVNMDEKGRQELIAGLEYARDFKMEIVDFLLVSIENLHKEVDVIEDKIKDLKKATQKEKENDRA
jgi:hypothetical protein